MALWGNTANTLNAPKWQVLSTGNATGNVAYGNVTVAAFSNNQVVGIFGPNDANAAAQARISTGGWHLVTQGTGPVATITVANGSGFANGETIIVSGGTLNAVAVITCNATGNLVSAALTEVGAGFANVASASIGFTREKHLLNIVVGGTPTGYSNTDTIVAANGTVNATATVVTNSTGGFVTANVTITNVGLWANTKANTHVAFSVVAANGSASAGTGATFTANIAGSTGGAASVTLGGRAGRVFYEPLVSLHITGDATVTNP